MDQNLLTVLNNKHLKGIISLLIMILFKESLSFFSPFYIIYILLEWWMVVLNTFSNNIVCASVTAPPLTEGQLLLHAEVGPEELDPPGLSN